MKPQQSMKPLPVQSTSTLNELVLCLDFDGVLCDSMYECMLSAFNAYYDASYYEVGQLPIAYRQFFLRHRYLAAPISDYFYLLQAFEMGESEIDRQKFSTIKIAHKAGAYTDHFLRTRMWLKRDRSRWLNLHKQYAESACVHDVDFPDFYIVTNKDRDSVEKLTRHHGYFDKVRAIYSREIGESKAMLMNLLWREHSLDPVVCRTVFVDDNYDNLHDLRSLPVQACLASWGYCSPDLNTSARIVRNLREALL